MVTRLRSGSHLCAKSMPNALSPQLPSRKSMSSTCQKNTLRRITIQSLYTVYNFYICNTKVEMARATLCVVLSAVYCILASVLLRVPPLKFPSLPISLPPILLPCSSPSLRSSLPPPLASSLPSFPRSVHAYAHSSFVPYLNPASLPPLPLPPSLTSSLPHSLPSLPPSPHSPCLLPHILHHPSSLLPCLHPCMSASRRPIQCTPYVCLASCAVLCSA